MKTLTFALLFSACTAALAVTTPITVNGKTISTATQERMIKQVVANGQKRTPELENQVRMQLIQREILRQESERLKLPQRADVKDAINDARVSISIQALMNEYAKNAKVTDKDVKAFYDQQKVAYGSKEYRLGIISVKTQAEANKAIASLKSKSFEDVAKSVSIDQATKKNGGVIDQWVSASRFPSPISYAIQNLTKGSHTTVPVEVGGTYHIVKVIDVRDAQLFPTYEKGKDHFKNLLVNSIVQKKVQELLQKATIN